MSNVIFWGLTGADFENSLWNGIYELSALGTGFAVAGVTNTVMQLVMNDNSARHNRKLSSKPIFCTMLSVGAGVAASVFVAHRLPHVTFVAEKAFKFLIIFMVGMFTAVIPFITGGGATGYFGRLPLYVAGSVGAIGGGIGSAVLLSARG